MRPTRWTLLTALVLCIGAPAAAQHGTADGATAMARVIEASGQVEDTLALSPVFSAAYLWRDADVMRAAVTLAQNRNASVNARVFAVMHLLGLLSPNMFFQYGTLVQGTQYVRDSSGTTVYRACRITGYSAEAPDTFATPLPADFAETIRTLLARMSGDPSLPQPLRNAAACVDWL